VPLALIADAVFGEPPPAVHPVVWIGRAIAPLERCRPRNPVGRLLFGAIGTGVVVGAAALFGRVIDRLVRRLPDPLGLLAESWLLKTTLSARALVQAGRALGACLDRDDLDGASRAARSLVSRDVAGLDRQLLASAAVESLAENTVDSIVAPLSYYAVGGLPAAFAYRAANTLDAMIGYRGEYEHLGKTAARLDDVLNLIPARLSTALLLGAGAIGGGDVRNGLAVARRDHGRTASPNAGWPMSAMAGLLGTRLEKPGHYRLGRELPPPDLAAIDHAADLVIRTTVLAVPVALLVRRLAGPFVARQRRAAATQ
jgi:adenosylcobinamide-phosphate synthase